MPGPIHSWLYIRDRSGLAYELINGARTKGYLSNPGLAVGGVDVCQPFTGLSCPTYPYEPYLGSTISGSVTIPNSGNNGIVSADSAAVDITGDITLVAKVAPNSWTTGSAQAVIGKWSISGTEQVSYILRITATGGLEFYFSASGTGAAVRNSTVVVPGAVAGQAKWVAVTFDVDNGASGNTARFWWSNNGINWTKIGADVVTAGVTSIFSSASPIRVGHQGQGTLPLIGTVYRASIYNGIGVGGVPGGTEVYRFDSDNIVDTTNLEVTSGVGLPSNILRPNLTLQAAVAGTPGYARFPGTTGNFLTVPDAANLDIVGDITFVVRARMWDWTPPSGSYTFISKRSANSVNAYRFGLLSSGLQIIISPDGTDTSQITLNSNVALTTINDGEWKWVAATLDVDNGATGKTARFWTSDNGTAWTQLGADVVQAAVTSIAVTTSIVEIGSTTNGTQNFAYGDIQHASIRNGTGASGTVGGTEVFRFDGTTITNTAATSFLAATGQTITVNKTATTSMTVTAATLCGAWQTQTFNTPTADPAPWYNSGYPQSADALGFIVEDWTGLDDGHVTRTSTPWGGYGGGAALAQIAAAGRTMKINVFLFGRSEEAVEYLFRWLGATLTGVCSSCATDSLLIRRFCGTTANLWDGVAEMRNVGLIEGIKWESEIAPVASCYVRRASFALMAGDPCMYSADTVVPADGSDLTPTNLSACFAASVPNPNRAICRPGCSEVKAACRLTRAFTVNPMAAMAPIVTWTNPMSQMSFPFRAVCYADPTLVGPSNPCGLPILGELYVRPLPPGSALRWDVVGRTVQYRDETTGGWASGWAYIDPNDPPEQRFFAVPCGKGYVVMEPASLCAKFVSGATWTLDGITYNPPTYPTVSVSIGERMSCP